MGNPGAGSSGRKAGATVIPGSGNSVKGPTGAGAGQTQKPPAADPVRGQIGKFGDKQTREALYAVYSVIKAAGQINPQQARRAMQVFQGQMLKDPKLTAGQVQGMAHQLQKGFSAQIGSTAALWAGGSRKLTGAQYNQQLLAQYNAYTGQTKNSVVPGVGNFYAAKSPTLSPAQQRRTDLFTAAMGSGPGLAALSGKAVGGALGALGRANSAKAGQGTGQAAPPLSQWGTPARPVSQTGTRAEYERGRQQARVAAYDPKRRTDAQLQKDLRPDVRPGETPQQARQRVDLAEKALYARGFSERPTQSLSDWEKYKAGLRMQMGKPYVEDPELDKKLKELYRPNAKIGSGSTADAVRTEIRTGEPVGGKWHDQKARNYLKSLEDWLKSNPRARPGDRAAAENVIQDMREALNTSK